MSAVPLIVTNTRWTILWLSLAKTLSVHVCSNLLFCTVRETPHKNAIKDKKYLQLSIFGALKGLKVVKKIVRVRSSSHILLLDKLKIKKGSKYYSFSIFFPCIFCFVFFNILISSTFLP